LLVTDLDVLDAQKSGWLDVDGQPAGIVALPENPDAHLDRRAITNGPELQSVALDVGRSRSSIQDH
jgi:hypothetical protein